MLLVKRKYKGWGMHGEQAWWTGLLALLPSKPPRTCLLLRPPARMRLHPRSYEQQAVRLASTAQVMMRKVQCADWLSDTVSQLETQAGGCTCIYSVFGTVDREHLVPAISC